MWTYATLFRETFKEFCGLDLEGGYGFGPGRHAFVSPCGSLGRVGVQVTPEVSGTAMEHGMEDISAGEQPRVGVRRET